jgi:nucleoside phosphorylase
VDNVDSLIIAAVPEEFTAAREAAERLGGTRWTTRDDGTAEPYLIGRFDALTVALARPPGMGSREGGPFIATLIDRVRPASLAMCGVCAGHPDETVLGDVIVAELAYQYDEGKQTSTSFRADHRQYPLAAAWKRGAQDFDPADLPSHRAATPDDGDTWVLSRIRSGRDYVDHPANERFPGPPAARLARLVAAGLVEDGGRKLTPAGEAELGRRTERSTRLPYAVRVGPMASVNQVRKDDLWTGIEDRGVRKILAVEMEAATVATVAFQRELRWLVVKGVMDHAGRDKNDGVKEFAARASAEVMFSLLSSFRRGTGRAARVVPGPVKLDVLRGLLGDWKELADRLGLQPHDTFRFTAGDQPRQVWEWLEIRGRLGDLPEALGGIGRTDLAELVRPYV